MILVLLINFFQSESSHIYKWKLKKNYKFGKIQYHLGLKKNKLNTKNDT